MTSKFLAELFGTFVLVFFGCGSAVLMGPQIGMSGIALTFGLTIVAAAYGIGAISGAHLNPAVSLGMLIAGRMTARACLGYAGAQILGAIAAAGLLYAVASGRPDFSLATDGLGQNGYGPGYLGGYSLASALLFESLATFVFVTVILGATAPRAPAAMAGLAIGLTLAMIHLTGITITGVSVNPARSIGPALWVGSTALAQLWVFLLAPLAGGALAGALHRAGLWQAAAA